MLAQQLRFFAPARPLLEQLGPEFFRELPRRPGVYLMLDRHERIIYVGQSNNLRSRLSSYKYVYPGQASRKTIRLVHAIEKILWEECPSAEAARLRENYLLRTHRPKFNAMNTYPPAYFFIRLHCLAGEMHLTLTREVDLASQTFGAFKAGCTAAFGALLRCLWTYIQRSTQPAQFPMGLLSARPPRSYLFAGDFDGPVPDDALPGLLQAYLQGTRATLIEMFRASISGLESARCLRAVHDQDLELLTDFFQRGPARLQKLRADLALADRWIAPHELDDAVVLGGTRGARAHEDLIGSLAPADEEVVGETHPVTVI